MATMDRTTPKASKEYTCWWCGETISKGETHVSLRAPGDDGWWSVRMHAVCAAVHDRLPTGDQPDYANLPAGMYVRGSTETRQKTDDVDVVRVTFTDQVFSVGSLLSSELYDKLVDEHATHELHRTLPQDMLYVRFRVPALRGVIAQTESFPANWKEAVKERFAPGWYKRRRPVRYVTVTLAADVVLAKVAERIMGDPERYNPVIFYRAHRDDTD